MSVGISKVGGKENKVTQQRNWENFKGKHDELKRKRVDLRLELKEKEVSIQEKVYICL